MHDQQGQIDRFVMGGEDGYVSVIDFDFGGSGGGRKGSGGSFGGLGKDRLMVNSQG